MQRPWGGDSKPGSKNPRVLQVVEMEWGQHVGPKPASPVGVHVVGGQMGSNWERCSSGFPVGSGWEQGLEIGRPLSVDSVPLGGPAVDLEAALSRHSSSEQSRYIRNLAQRAPRLGLESGSAPTCGSRPCPPPGATPTRWALARRGPAHRPELRPHAGSAHAERPRACVTARPAGSGSSRVGPA